MEMMAFFPNTTLREDIRHLVVKTFPIVMICSKHKTEEKYNVITKKGKLFDAKSIPLEIRKLLIENLI